MQMNNLKSYLNKIKNRLEITIKEGEETALLNKEEIGFIKGELSLTNQILKKIDKETNKNEIAISLYAKEWEQIANACIYIEDYIEIEKGYKIQEQIKDALRKTYFTIKANTR